MDQKWADKVFKPNYERLEHTQVFAFMDKYGPLPWIRSEKTVQETGVDLVEDHINLLEAVENLYRFFRDWLEKRSQPKPGPEVEQEQLQGMVGCGENSGPEVRKMSMLPDAARNASFSPMCSNMDRGQCGNDRSRFGVIAVS
jgi:hypothetical protein